VAYHLLTVDHSHPVEGGVQIAPTVRMRRLVHDIPLGTMVPMTGDPVDPVELRLPDGRTRQAAIRAFGVDGWEDNGRFYTTSNLEDPELSLSLQGLSLADLPPGTEVWLPGLTEAASAPTAGPCTYCQVAQAREGRTRRAPDREADTPTATPRPGPQTAISHSFLMD
jgi:hypothetical protein